MAGKRTPPALSAREVRFCKLYFERGNATQCFIDAGLYHKNRRSAEQLAWLLLRKLEIRTFIRELREAAADAARLAAEFVTVGYMRAAFADRRGLFGPDGEMLPPHLWPDDVAATVEGVEVEELEETDPVTKKKTKVGQKWKVKTERRAEARKFLAQVLGMVKGDGEAAAEKLIKIITGVDPSKM